MAILALVRPDGSFVVDVLPASLIAAAGMSLAFIPTLGTAIQSAKPEEGGLASGIVNTSYQVGSALGLAAMTALASAYGADQLGDAVALTDGYSAAFLGAAGIALVGALAAAALLRTPRAGAGGRRRRRSERQRVGVTIVRRRPITAAGAPGARRRARGESASPSSAGPR